MHRVDATGQVRAAARLLRTHVGGRTCWKEFGWGDFCKPTVGDDFECGSMRIDQKREIPMPASISQQEGAR